MPHLRVDVSAALRYVGACTDRASTTAPDQIPGENTVITSIVYLGPEADKARDHVAGFEVEEYLGIGPRKLKALVRDGYIHPIGAVGGDPSKPIFSMRQVRALHPGEQEELFAVE